jgi:hypothetical protein
MRTRELLELRNTGHPGINALFAKAHSAGWDIERDVDWTAVVAADDPLVVAVRRHTADNETSSGDALA